MIYDTHKRRMMDANNGDFMLLQRADHDQHEWYVNLYDQHDQPLLASVVQVQNLDELGNSGTATLIRCVLQKTWVPTDRPEPPTYFDETHPQIPRLAAFLEARLRAGGAQTPSPRFEFTDGRLRLNDQRAEAFAWADTPQKSSVKGTHILLGLLLTLGLHFGHVLVLSAVAQIIRGNQLWYFYFGFTQLLYMLPAIFLSRPRRGQMIGLIIGAAVTFMLGLPLAAIAIICGNMRGL